MRVALGSRATIRLQATKLRAHGERRNKAARTTLSAQLCCLHLVAIRAMLTKSAHQTEGLKMYRDPFASDSENMMTPNRRAEIMRRLQAEARMREYRRASAHKRAHGALPANHPAHTRACSGGCDDIAGILFSDGAVHLFDREDTLHVEYAREARNMPNIESGASMGDQGWAFYVDRYDRSVLQYMLPSQFVPAVQEVVSTLLS